MKISLHKKENKFWLEIDQNYYFVGDYSDGPTVVLDELLELLHEKGIIEYHGILF